VAEPMTPVQPEQVPDELVTPLVNAGGNEADIRASIAAALTERTRKICEQIAKNGAVSTRPPCKACEESPIGRGKRGWCSSCYWRWYRAGKPEGGPPPPQKPNVTACEACDSADGPFVRGWCPRCYGRWLNVGKPETGPPSERPPAKPGPCMSCGEEVAPCKRRHGWCQVCYQRWVNEGKPEGGPSKRKTRNEIRLRLQAHARNIQERRRDGLPSLRDEGIRLSESGFDVDRIATELNVQPGTVKRWLRDRADQIDTAASDAAHTRKDTDHG
jgi:hypothetical protein